MRIVLLILGFASLGVGAVGVVLPGVPTTPLVLVATDAFFAGRDSVEPEETVIVAGSFLEGGRLNTNRAGKLGHRTAVFNAKIDGDVLPGTFQKHVDVGHLEA